MKDTTSSNGSQYPHEQQKKKTKPLSREDADRFEAKLIAMKTDVESTPYLVRKNLPPLGEACRNEDRLVLPYRDYDGTLRNIQEIPEKGKAMFLPGISVQGSFFRLPSNNSLSSDCPVYLAEGYADGATCSMACPEVEVWVMGGTHNLKALVEIARTEQPGSPLVAVLDNDEQLRKMQGICYNLDVPVVVPRLRKGERDGKPLKDIDDFRAEYGLEQTRELLLKTTYQRPDMAPSEAYSKTARGFIFNKRIKKGDDILIEEIQISDFTASIIEETRVETGIDGQDEIYYLIQGENAFGPFPQLAEVNSAGFPTLKWIARTWGATARIFPGSANKDRVEYCIQAFSNNRNRRQVYGCTGWMKLGGEWKFLHAGGALGAEDNDSTVEVRIPIKGLRLSTTRNVPSCHISPLLEFLNLSPTNNALGYLCLATMFRAPTDSLLPVTVTVFFSGRTGCKKTETALLIQRAFGSTFGMTNIPANWTSTAFRLGKELAMSKDVVVLVDDYKPEGQMGGARELQRKAQHIVHDGIGNKSGRARLTAELRDRPTFVPRCMLVSTGEDMPGTASLRARVVFLNFKQDTVDNAVLTKMQRDSEAGLYCDIMSDYIQWLAPKIDKLTETLPEIMRSYRGDVLQDSHARSPDNLGHLMIGIRMLAEFVIETGRCDRDWADGFIKNAEKELYQLLSEQDLIVKDADPVRRYVRVLFDIFKSKQAYLEPSSETVEPKNLRLAWGWLDDGFGIPVRPPNKSRAGFVDAKCIYLLPGIIYKLIVEHCKQDGTEFIIGQTALSLQLIDKGLLVRTPTMIATNRPYIQKTINGCRSRYMTHDIEALYKFIED